MTQEERIIKKVYDAKKVELGTHKVDLALVDDIQKISNDAKKELANSNTARVKAIASIDEMMASYRQNAVLSNNAINIIADFKAKTKDLGIDIPSNIVNLEKELQTNSKSSQDQLKFLQNIKKSL
jgi:endo-alpha-1,4-polygalactosaminidase (GH114 family)